MGLKKRRGRGGEIFPLSSPPLPLSHPSSLSIFFCCCQDISHNQCTSEFPLKKTPALKGTDIGVIASGTEDN